MKTGETAKHHQIFDGYKKGWFGRRFSITGWCACSVAFSYTTDRLVEMQWCSFFC
ncbi:hypothetical protein NQ074_15135 [Escherichia coli]|nr:hypothetical protein [Escherichia coli]MDF7547856.1 hypothetical protein [Escherichia coli]